VSQEGTGPRAWSPQTNRHPTTCSRIASHRRCRVCRRRMFWTEIGSRSLTCISNAISLPRPHRACHAPHGSRTRMMKRRQESVWLWGSDETTSPRVGDVLLAMPEPDSTVDGSVGAQQRHLHLHLQWQSGADCFHDPCDAIPWCAGDDADRDTPRDMPNDPEGRSRSSGALGYASPVPSTPPAPLSST
jgi:hypothetical protein